MDARRDRRLALGVPRRGSGLDAFGVSGRRLRSTGSDIYVVARGGIFAGFGPEAMLRVFEPSLGGREVAVMRDTIFEAGAGAVAKVELPA
jgi:hypothetical protein